MKREFLMKAHTYKNSNVAGWFMSEKYDGMRCFWDGGVTRGMPKADVPWANIEKDARYKNKQVATGLWSTYGHPIYASKEWLDSLPKMPLDGELWLGRGVANRQKLMSIVKSHDPDPFDWNAVEFHIFDSPKPDIVYTMGDVNGRYVSKIDNKFLRCDVLGRYDFESVYTNLLLMFQDKHPHIKLIQQIKLSDDICQASSIITRELDYVSDLGGEGLVLRDPYSFWEPCRSHNLLKIKKLFESEAIVIGYISGKETDKGSKLLGMMGALIVEWKLLNKSIIFELSGFTEKERTLTDSQWASEHPGQKCPDHVSSIHFPRGTNVTFKYRDLSRDNVPQEARYHRKRED